MAPPRDTLRAPGGAALPHPRRRLRGARRRVDDRARVPAARDRPGRRRSASSTSSRCCSSRRSGARGSACSPRSRRALAFNYFHIPPTGRFTIADSENWVALVGVPDRRRDRQLGRAGGPRAGRPRPTSAAARPTSPRRWRGCCCAATSCRSRCPPRRSGSRPRSTCRRRRSSSPRSRATSSASPSRCARGRTQTRHAGRAGRAARGVAAAPAGARGAVARGAAGGRARARRAARRRRSRRARCAARRRQDRAAALGLPRPAHAADRDRGRRGGDRARRRSPTRSGASSAPSSPARARGCRG